MSIARRGWGEPELIWGITLLGLASILAFTQYRKAIELYRLNAARGTVAQIAAANLKLHVERKTYFAGAVGNESPLVQSGRMSPRDWGAEHYEFEGADDLFSPCILAKARRKTKGIRGTDVAPFARWGLCEDTAGHLERFGPDGICPLACATPH